jgi:hypothetical protein
MSVKKRTLAEVRLAGLEILAKELGPADYLRFLQQFEPGYGDYTSERHGWLDEVDGAAVVQMIEQRRARAQEAKEHSDGGERRERLTPDHE